MGPEIISLPPYQPFPDERQGDQGGKKKILEKIPWRALVVVLSLLCLLTFVSINRYDIDLQQEILQEIQQKIAEKKIPEFCAAANTTRHKRNNPELEEFSTCRKFELLFDCKVGFWFSLLVV